VTLQNPAAAEQKNHSVIAQTKPDTAATVASTEQARETLPTSKSPTASVALPLPHSEVPCVGVLQGEVTRLDGVLEGYIASKSTDRKAWNAAKAHLGAAQGALAELERRFQAQELDESGYKRV